MLQDIKKLDDIYELLKGNICDDPENYPGYILVKNDYDVCFRIFIYRELLQSTLTFYIDNSENPDNLIIYLRGINNHENNSKEFVLAYNSDNNTYYDENNVYNIYDSTKNILDEIIRHYKIIKKDVPVESTRIEIGVSDVRYMIEHTLSQDYSEYGDNKYTDDGIQASNKYKDESLNLSTYSSISDFQNYISNKNNTANQRFVNDLENTTIDEEFKQIIDEIFANYNIDKELYIRFSPHDEIEGVRETQVKLAIEKDGKIPQYEDDTEYYDSIVAKEKTPLFNRNLIYQNNKIDYIENKFGYLTFYITTGGTINFTGTGSNVLYYSRNNGTTWVEASGNIPVSAGDKILWKGVTTPGTTSSNYGIGKFGGDTDVRYTVGGNVMSLLFGDNFKDQTSLEGKDYAFYRLFNNNKNITSAENLSLPATTLTSDCYNYMFYGCTNLTTAPSVLPATILAERCYMSMFNDCTGLITAPELPATTLKFSCYSNMFGGCTNLTTAPELPATTLAPNCYYHMFKKCTNLTTAPELLATILIQNCYREMFQGCTSLTTAPELPAITLAQNCYSDMFNGCTSLTIAPELPATTLVDSCYKGMFGGCTSLTIAPELPATTLANYCYHRMFENCTSLTTAPELPATTLTDTCYYSMFNSCTSLSTIKCLATNISASDCTYNWVWGVAASGIFIKDPSMEDWTISVNGIPSGWDVLPKDYFATVVTASGNIAWAGTSTNALSYSTDNGITWSDPSGNITLPVNEGDKVLWKGITTPGTSSPNQGIGKFGGDTNVRYSVEGNAMSLLYGDDFKGQISLVGKDYALYNLFRDNINITSAENLSLPATTLANDCYTNMFYSCSSLTIAPELPATTLAQSCYQSMFQDCTSLTTVPELSATTLARSCYQSMFQGCTSLTTAPQLPARTLVYYCYQSMFQGCTSLTTVPQLPATTLAQNCYCSMFQGCTSLTTAPQLPATTLGHYCYQSMFRGCTNLTIAPQLPATKLREYCYYQMFRGCTSLVIAPELPATTLAQNCYREMFDGCTSLTIAPDLPATTLAYSCYNNMFYGCTKLTTAPQLPATTLADYCYAYMFSGCTSLTTVPRLPARTLVDYCYYCMFYNCTSITTAPDLPATTLVRGCYYWMFSGCTNLNSIWCLATNKSASECTKNWVWGVAVNGTFTKDYDTYWATGASGIPTGWTVESV